MRAFGSTMECGTIPDYTEIHHTRATSSERHVLMDKGSPFSEILPHKLIPCSGSMQRPPDIWGRAPTTFQDPCLYSCQCNHGQLEVVSCISSSHKQGCIVVASIVCPVAHQGGFPKQSDVIDTDATSSGRVLAERIFRGFLFLGRRSFSRIFSPDFFSSFLWEKVPRKILQENPRENPPKFIQQKSSDTLLQIGWGETSRSPSCRLYT